MIVDFLEGDPDQPIIVGTVYNADQMPPYLGQGPDAKHKNDNKVSGFKSNTTKGGQGFNELRFDDTKDKEQVFVHAEKDIDIRVKNDAMESVLDDRHLTVGQEKDGKKEGDFKELVVRDHHTKVRRHEERQVGGNLKMLVGGDEGDGKVDLIVKDERKAARREGRAPDREGLEDGLRRRGREPHRGWGFEDAGRGDLSLAIDGNVKERVGASIGFAASEDFAVEVGGKICYRSTAEMTLDTMSVLFLTGKSVTIAAGGGFIKIDSSGVTIEGTKVKINCGGSPDTAKYAFPKAPDSPDGPKEPEEARPAVPDTADDARTGQKSN